MFYLKIRLYFYVGIVCCLEIVCVCVLESVLFSRLCCVRGCVLRKCVFREHCLFRVRNCVFRRCVFRDRVCLDIVWLLVLVVVKGCFCFKYVLVYGLSVSVRACLVMDWFNSVL